MVRMLEMTENYTKEITEINNIIIKTVRIRAKVTTILKWMTMKQGSEALEIELIEI